MAIFYYPFSELQDSREPIPAKSKFPSIDHMFRLYPLGVDYFQRLTFDQKSISR
jgi:hypothetical protein